MHHKGLILKAIQNIRESKSIERTLYKAAVELFNRGFDREQVADRMMRDSKYKSLIKNNRDDWDEAFNDAFNDTHSY